MSVVCVQDGVMAADSRAYSGNGHPIGEKLKIHRLKDGSLLGVTSNQVGTPETFRNWLEAGADRGAFIPSDMSFAALWLREDGVYLFDDSYVPAGPLEGKFFSIGSGRKYAQGAHHAGATLYNCVQAAIANDVWCGGRVRMLGLNAEELDV